jgi:hypothetical protein
MSNFLAAALGLAFTLVVCLLALQALLGPWLRLRRAPAVAAGHADEKHAPPAARQGENRPVHTA